jgi:protein transport protein SEC24
MNPFVRWLDGGRRFQCNLCGSMNDTPAWYFCNVGPNGTRRDMNERPELTYGSVEYVASNQYVVRPPERPGCVFLIDVSTDAVESGITHRICEAILNSLEQTQTQEQQDSNNDKNISRIAPGKIAIATFSNTIQYISMKPGCHQPQITVIPDVSSPYAPLSGSLLLDAEENRREIVSIVKFVMSMYSTKNEQQQGLHQQEQRHSSSSRYCPQESCACAAIHSAGKVMEASGGKVIAFIASLTNVGEGATQHPGSQHGTKNPQDDKSSRSDRNGLVKMIWPGSGDVYTTVAEELAEKQVCVDLFTFSRLTTSFLNVASLRLLSERTGGSFVGYQSFDGSAGENGDAKRLCHDLRHNLTREQGFEALLRVRTSHGMKVEEYKGSFLVRTSTDVDLAGIDADKSIVAYVKHEEKLKEGQEVAFQCALLYTTCLGERRIRVHTLSLPTTSVLGNVYRSADLDAQMHATLRSIVSHYPKMEPQGVKEAATNACVNILYAYRKYCATSSSTGQLILPEALKLMPLYMLAFNKLQSLEAKCAPDERARLVALLSSISVPNLLPLLFPRLVALQNVTETNFDGMSGQVPDLLSCSSEAMDDDAVLLLLEKNVGYIWIGLGVYPPVLQRLFGETQYDKIQHKLENTLVGQTQSNLDQNHPANAASSPLAFQVVSSLCPGKCVRLKFVARGSVMETKFLAKLVEDRTQSGMSYVEYLCHVHRQIQKKFL